MVGAWAVAVDEVGLALAGDLRCSVDGHVAVRMGDGGFLDAEQSQVHGLLCRHVAVRAGLAQVAVLSEDFEHPVLSDVQSVLAQHLREFPDEARAVRRGHGVREPGLRLQRLDMLGLFWNFYNVAWDHSLIPVPAKGSMDDCLNQIQTAFARYPDTYVYDSALLRLPDNYISPDGAEGQIESTLEAYRKEQIPKILSASSDTEFEKQYQLFVTTQKELGAEKLDQKINRQMQENFSYYGKKIEKVNPQMQDTSKPNGETKP